MKKINKKTGAALFAVILLVLYAISWIITCGIILLITTVFNITFDLLVATLIWLAIAIIKAYFTFKRR